VRPAILNISSFTSPIGGLFPRNGHDWGNPQSKWNNNFEKPGKNGNEEVMDPPGPGAGRLEENEINLTERYVRG
jgi:hypothetical protein